MGTSTATRLAWIDHVAAWSASGQTQRAYCEAQGLRYHAFDYWRRFVLKHGVLKQDASSTPPQNVPTPAAKQRGGRPGPATRRDKGRRTIRHANGCVAESPKR